MKKNHVLYSAGESRNGNFGVDFMLVRVDEIELYAEAVPDPEDDTTTYDSLKEEILYQAKKNSIDVPSLVFLYD